LNIIVIPWCTKAFILYFFCNMRNWLYVYWKKANPFEKTCMDQKIFFYSHFKKPPHSRTALMSGGLPFLSTDDYFNWVCLFSVPFFFFFFFALKKFYVTYTPLFFPFLLSFLDSCLLSRVHSLYIPISIPLFFTI